MPSTGAFNPTTAAELAGPGISWANVGAATGVPDGSGAQVGLAGVSNSNWLRLTSAAAGRVPANATITGIQVRLRAQHAGSTHASASYRLVSGGQIITTRSIGNTSPAWAWLTDGGEGNMIGLGSLAPALVNGVFGVDVMMTTTGEDESDVDLDAAELTLWYTLPGSGPRSVTVGLGVGL